MNPSNDDRNLLFWPIKIDNNTIALRSVGNNRICQLHNWGNINRCLNAAVELVLNRSIYNVRYRMEDARIYGETPYAAGTTTASNFSNQDAEVGVQITYEESSSYTFSRSLSLTAGVTTTISAGVPLVAGGSIEISYQVNAAFEWGESRTRTKTVTATGTIPVPARSVASVRYVATMGTCDVPYS
ncbi:natterin-2-like [Salvia hispanica]|uniref:natterin-2-like n=1 Tax=Salvia hispanica TaxID=49212 RepID=UPI0020099C1A|nr:natterin-2-like [Salvia hispanica]